MVVKAAVVHGEYYSASVSISGKLSFIRYRCITPRLVSSCSCQHLGFPIDAKYPFNYYSCIVGFSTTVVCGKNARLVRKSMNGSNVSVVFMK